MNLLSTIGIIAVYALIYFGAIYSDALTEYVIRFWLKWKD